MNRWNSLNLHEELALYYSNFRGVLAPRNTITEDLWKEIERVEEAEGVRDV
jgi:hypothetical protein